MGGLVFLVSGTRLVCKNWKDFLCEEWDSQKLLSLYFFLPASESSDENGSRKRSVPQAKKMTKKAKSSEEEESDLKWDTIQEAIKKAQDFGRNPAFEKKKSGRKMGYSNDSKRYV
jgi:hypothetical protein